MTNAGGVTNAGNATGGGRGGKGRGVRTLPIVLVLAAAFVLSGIVVAWRVGIMVRSRPGIGDGRDPATYRFDLSNARVPLDLIAAGGLSRDGIPALTDPPVTSPEETDLLNEEERGKYLVPSDRVVGVAIGGEARAYPIRVLNWHEIVNDRLGGAPIAVTYSGLCDSVAVFDREIDGGSGGAPVEFGVSGLLLNSNLLLYDRQTDPEKSSLWSQLEARAIAGPAADRGARLDPVGFAVVRWDTWRELHPATTVLARDPGMKKAYNRDPYGSYYGTDRLRFPVRPLPADGTPAPKSRVLAVLDGNGWRVFPFPWALAAAGDDDGIPVRLADGGATLVIGHAPTTLRIERANGTPGPAVIQSMWFAWHAAHPESAATLPDAR